MWHVSNSVRLHFMSFSEICITIVWAPQKRAPRFYKGHTHVAAPLYERFEQSASQLYEGLTNCASPVYECFKRMHHD